MVIKCPYCRKKNPTDKHLKNELKKHNAIMRHKNKVRE